MKKPLLAVSVGCPSGVGPEVALLGAAGAKDFVPLIVGDPDVMRKAAALRGIAAARLREVETAAEARKLPPRMIGILRSSERVAGGVVPGKPSDAAGRAQLAWIDRATDLVAKKEADALVTGPVSKLAISQSGARGSKSFRGHTEHLAKRLGAREVVMAFSSEALTTALVTTHLSLSKVPRAITPDAVATSTAWLVWLLRRLGKKRPKVAIASLNPHAGEGGILGDEEITRIAPGIAKAMKRLAKERAAADLVGPIGAETAFRLASRGGFDGVVAMYHDQATIPCKIMGFGEAVNITLGLPIVRTSVDHGTGYDVAWTGKADARGMIEAMELAVRLVRGRRD